MKIYCKSSPNITGSQLVNKVGKYLYNHLDGAYKYSKDRNTYDVYVTLLYELKPEYGGIPNDVQEMTIDISITTYQNKIRVDTIEMTPESGPWDLISSRLKICMIWSLQCPLSSGRSEIVSGKHIRIIIYCFNNKRAPEFGCSNLLYIR